MEIQTGKQVDGQTVEDVMRRQPLNNLGRVEKEQEYVDSLRKHFSTPPEPFRQNDPLFASA